MLNKLNYLNLDYEEFIKGCIKNMYRDNTELKNMSIESIIEELENICYNNEYVLELLGELKERFYEVKNKAITRCIRNTYKYD